MIKWDRTKVGRERVRKVWENVKYDSGNKHDFGLLLPQFLFFCRRQYYSLLSLVLLFFHPSLTFHSLLLPAWYNRQVRERESDNDSRHKMTTLKKNRFFSFLLFLSCVFSPSHHQYKSTFTDVLYERE
jgi:hypothetical protein